MDKKVFIKAIREYLELLEYKAIGVGAGSVSLENGNCRIGIGYYKILEGFRFPSQIAGYKSFPEVENILQLLYKKHKLGFQNYTIYKISRRFENIALIDLYTPDDLQKIHLELKTMVYEDILPFFDEFQNISQIISRIDLLPKEDISRFICHPPLPRIMILKKLNNDNNWTDYCDWVVEIYKTMVSSSNGRQHEGMDILVAELYNKLIKL